MQQPLACEDQVGQRSRNLQILGQPPLSHLLEAEHPLDDADGVLEVGADADLLRLTALIRLSIRSPKRYRRLVKLRAWDATRLYMDATSTIGEASNPYSDARTSLDVA